MVSFGTEKGSAFFIFGNYKARKIDIVRRKKMKTLLRNCIRFAYMHGLVFFIPLTAEIEESILLEAEKKKFLEKISSNCIVLRWLLFFLFINFIAFQNIIRFIPNIGRKGKGLVGT